MNWHLSNYQSTLHIEWSELDLNRWPSGSQAKSPRTELLPPLFKESVTLVIFSISPPLCTSLRQLEDLCSGEAREKDRREELSESQTTPDHLCTDSPAEDSRRARLNAAHLLVSAMEGEWAV